MEIESGIHRPAACPARTELGRKVRTMEVGQSILCTTPEDAQRIRDALRSARMKASQRKLAEGGYRVWRIE